MVFEALVYSRLLYNSHTWTAVTPSALDHWETALRPMLYTWVRSELRGLAPYGIPLATLCGLAGLLTPGDALHVARLRFIRRLLCHCPKVLWGLIWSSAESPHAWLPCLRASLQWMSDFVGPGSLPSAHAPWQDWWLFIRADERWKGRIQRAVKACKTWRRETAQADVWNRWFAVELEQRGVTLAAPRRAPPAPWSCDQCGASFASRRALATHATKAHGYRCIYQHYAVDGSCPHCARDFHHRSRLRAHWRTAHGCFDNVVACFPALSGDLFDALADEDLQLATLRKQQGWLATKALSPAVRAFGPGLPPAGSPDAALMKQKWDLRRPLDGQVWFSELIGRCEYEVPSSPVQVAAGPGSDGLAFVVQSQGHLKGSADCFAEAGLARMHAILHIRTLCFVHFYSGHRREYDLQWAIENHWCQGATQVFCISVDFCLQSDRADLSTVHSRKWWTDRIFAGAICGCGGGPPCETFSAARWLPDGPPPLRSYDELYGFKHLTARQWHQVSLGTLLLHFLLEMALAVAIMGGCSFIEHPAFPVWARDHRPASVWASKAVRLLRRLECCRVLTLDQCIYGCPARKPTTLLLVRMQGVVARSQRLGLMGRCPHGRCGHVALQGRDESGEFRTAVAKIYPPGLNYALAESVVDFCLSLLVDGKRVEPLAPDIAAFLSRDFVASTVVQPDYYR